MEVVRLQFFRNNDKEKSLHQAHVSSTDALICLLLFFQSLLNPKTQNPRSWKYENLLSYFVVKDEYIVGI